MKNSILITAFLICTLSGFSQKADVKNMDTPVTVAVTTAPDERISKLEAEIASLKASQVEMKKQLSEIQSQIPAIAKKKKLIVNRAGSKQVNWATED